MSVRRMLLLVAAVALGLGGWLRARERIGVPKMAKVGWEARPVGGASEGTPGWRRRTRRLCETGCDGGEDVPGGGEPNCDEQEARRRRCGTIAQAVMDECATSNAKLTKLAKEHDSGMVVENGPAFDHAEMIATLEKLEGAAFDEEYLRQMEKAHREMIALFKSESTYGHNEDVRVVAERTLPVLVEEKANIGFQIRGLATERE